MPKARRSEPSRPSASSSSAASPVKWPTAAATTSLPKRMLGSGSRTHFPRGDVRSTEMVPPGGSTATRSARPSPSASPTSGIQGGWAQSPHQQRGRSDGTSRRRPSRRPGSRPASLTRSTKHRFSVPSAVSPSVIGTHFDQGAAKHTVAFVVYYSKWNRKRSSAKPGSRINSLPSVVLILSQERGGAPTRAASRTQNVARGSLPRGVGRHLRDRPGAGVRDVRRRAGD